MDTFYNVKYTNQRQKLIDYNDIMNWIDVIKLTTPIKKW